MPGNHGEISLDEQNGGDSDNDNNKARRRRKKKKKKDDAKEVGIADGFEGVNQSVMPSISKPSKRFIDRIRKKPKSPKRSSSSSSSSRSGSRKGGCFSVMRPRRREEDGDSSPTSDPNDESFTHEMLKVMLETNDFCSDECNPHR